MINLLFVLLAAILWAIHDTLAHHYSVSVFNKMDERFWNPEVSWKYTGFLPFTRYRLDAWHITKSVIIALVLMALALHRPLVIIQYPFPGWAAFTLYGLLFNGVFNLFYNKLLLR